MKYLKAEIYRMFHSKLLISSLILIILYSFFGAYVYTENNLNISELYSYFGQEYLLIFLVISFSFSIFLFNEDIKHKLFYEYDRLKMLITRFMLWFMMLLLVIFISALISLIITKLLHLKTNLSYSMVLNIIKVIPLIGVYNLILLIILFITKKASYAVMLAFGSYTFFMYVQNAILNLKEKALKYLIFFNLDFNNLYIKLAYAVIILIIVVTILIILLNYLFKKMT